MWSVFLSGNPCPTHARHNNCDVEDDFCGGGARIVGFDKILLQHNFLTLKLCRGSGRDFLADLIVNSASESACLVPVKHPEQARAMGRTDCNA